MAARKNRFNEDLQKDAVHQVIERGYSVVEVAQRLGISPKTLYGWKAKYAKRQRPHKKSEDKDPDREIAKLKAELKRVTEERDILGRCVLCQRVRVRYAFIKVHRHEFRVTSMWCVAQGS